MVDDANIARHIVETMNRAIEAKAKWGLSREDLLALAWMVDGAIDKAMEGK